MYIEQIIYTLIVYCHIKSIFLLIFKHGHSPATFKEGVSIRVIKNNKDENDVYNYRPVIIIYLHYYLNYIKYACAQENRGIFKYGWLAV